MHPGKFDKKEAKFLEIYNEDFLLDSLSLDDFHEKVLNENTFGN